MRNQSIVYRGDVFPDGTTDVTRTMHYGTPTNLEREIYTNLLMGCINLASTKFPEGQTLNTLEVLIRAPLYSMGLDYGHGSTHGVGAFLGVHEEPGYYRANEFGMRLENVVTVIRADVSMTTDNNVTYLAFDPVTLVPYEQKLINVSMLSGRQLQWLNDYHARTRELVGAEMLRQNLTNTYDWLVRKTQPIYAVEVLEYWVRTDTEKIAFHFKSTMLFSFMTELKIQWCCTVVDCGAEKRGELRG
uniref:Xaa-Pro aminopeptidase n=1 Tax=Timema poppense TaxID=170557 RepID=A0A7R9DCZ9_TIMPO|nr:unnamed protein product [Timema poppensis]